ncbi:protease B nonderepressible form [Diatrype stigma]|uniref:Protein PBN1 n=1 Tax=Diatrype stigma TaxID=117547 RepID=A0AAN9YP03_9PEZI
MRQRTTFFHKNEDGIEPTDLKVAGRTISGPDLLAVREDRITLGLEELPTELRELLKETHELHIRWVSPNPHESIGPWNSRLPPGLHVFYTPGQGGEKTGSSPELLCPLIRNTFGVSDCSTLLDSFTRLPNDRFSHSTAYQYYQPLESLAHFVLYANRYACTSSSSSGSDCTRQVERLASATSLDFSYDAISHTAKLTALWPHEHQPFSLSSSGLPDHHRVEVGLLTPDESPHIEQHELGVTGLLTVLDGDDDAKPSPVLFSFPSRHMRAGRPSAFSAEFLAPTGLHPTLRLRFDGPARAPVVEEGVDGEEDEPACSLHAYLTLPRAVFADRYQLADDNALFLASKNLTALRWASQPVDLEAPDYVMKLWGSSVLLELRPPTAAPEEKGQKGQEWTAEIPLHLRYLAPAPGGYRTVQVPYPAVFWACPADEGTKFPNSPFDRVDLGYDGLFGPRTQFWHVSPEPSRNPASGPLMNSVRVPVLDLDRSAWVRSGTAAVVLLGFAWVVWKLVGVYARAGSGGKRNRAEGEKKVQ